MREVVVTGIGCVLPGCDTKETLWYQLATGESQLAFEESPEGEGVWAVGRVRFDPASALAELPSRHVSRYSRDQQLYLASVLRARDDAGLDLKSLLAGSVGLFDGTSRGSFDAWYTQICAESATPRAQLYTRRELTILTPGQAVSLAAIALGVRGPTYTFNSSCASGAVAIGHACREIAAGNLEIALASGHESALSVPIYLMYRDADLLSGEEEDARRAIRPYVGHSRNAFGEGAVTLVLEERERAERRGATILAKIIGYRYVNHAEHPTAVDTTGRVAARLVNGLLTATRTDGERIGFVVGHGNGVPVSDLSEIALMKRLFGPRVGEVPLVSIKPIYGHLLGAASALNAAAGALMVRRKFVVPTINIDETRVVSGMNHQANHGAETARDVGVSLAFGIGGHNTALLLGDAASEGVRRAERRSRRRA